MRASSGVPCKFFALIFAIRAGKQFWSPGDWQPTTGGRTTDRTRPLHPVAHSPPSTPPTRRPRPPVPYLRIQTLHWYFTNMLMVVEICIKVKALEFQSIVRGTLHQLHVLIHIMVFLL